MSLRALKTKIRKLQSLSFAVYIVIGVLCHGSVTVVCVSKTEIVLYFFIANNRDSKGKFVMKSGGSLKEQEKRQKDRERKQFDRVLKIFETLSVKSQSHNFKYICIIQKDNGEVHYNGTKEFNKKFQNNEALCDYTDSMIETRRESILKKINVRSALKMAVEPSPCKNQEAPNQMAFLPGLSPHPSGTKKTLGLTQKLDLQGMVPQSEQSIAVSSDQNVALKRKTFTRQRRKNPKMRLETAKETEAEDKERGKGVRKVQKKK